MRGAKFDIGPGEWGSIPGQVISKIPKMALDAALLYIEHYEVRIKCKKSNTGKGVVRSATP